MKKALLAILLMTAGVAYAQSSTGTGVNGTGVSFVGMAQTQLPNRTITLNIGGGATPSITVTKGGAGPGTVVSTSSVGLSIGAILGSGFGSTGGLSGSAAGALANGF
jgi:hypothetical protein